MGANLIQPSPSQMARRDGIPKGGLIKTEHAGGSDPCLARSVHALPWGGSKMGLRMDNADGSAKAYVLLEKDEIKAVMVMLARALNNQDVYQES